MILDKLIQPVANILDKFVADKDLKAKLQHELETAIHSANLAQLEVNKAEAAHKSVFVAGWRPFVGWVCGVALSYHFILAPLLSSVAHWLAWIRNFQSLILVSYPLC